MIATRPHVTKPPQVTVGELCRAIAESNYGALVRAGAAWRDDVALGILLNLASAQFGVPVEKLSARSRLNELAPYG